MLEMLVTDVHSNKGDDQGKGQYPLEQNRIGFGGKELHAHQDYSLLISY